MLFFLTRMLGRVRLPGSLQPLRPFHSQRDMLAV